MPVVKAKNLAQAKRNMRRKYGKKVAISTIRYHGTNVYGRWYRARVKTMKKKKVKSGSRQGRARYQGILRGGSIGKKTFTFTGKVKGESRIRKHRVPLSKCRDIKVHK